FFSLLVYEVVTVTGDVKGAGTDANVFVSLYGEFGVTPKVLLASNAAWFLDRAVLMDMNRPHLRFFFACNSWLSREEGDGLTYRYLLGSLNPLDIVVIDDMGNKELYEFPVDAWFDISEGDGKIQRDVVVGATQPMIVYNVQVMTGDIRGAGTNSKIHLVMHGRKGIKNSGKMFLEGGTFERAQIDIFNVEIVTLLSPLSRVTIGHDNAGISCGWYCEKVTVYCPFTGIEQVFPCGRWLDEDEGDGMVERELYEMVSLRQRKQKLPWSLWIFTSDMKGAGTDAQVFIQVYGEKGKSDIMKLESKSDSFEQGQCDKFLIELCDIGKIRKLRIWHEKRNPFSGWHLGRVTLMKLINREKYNFTCNRWLDINEDDQEIIRELPATGYRITICTGTVNGSGTDASVYLTIIGDLGDTGERLMFLCKNTVNKFEKGNADEFMVEAVSLGTIRRIRIGHDGRGGGCGWFLDKVLIREEGQPEASSVEFPCLWLDRNEDDGQIVRELVPSADGQRLFVSYHIAIKTGSINGASSDSKVFVKLYGEKGDTEKILVVVSDNDLGNYFETGQTDIFTVETYDIGKINRLLIGHTNEGLRAGWFLDSVLIWVPVHGVQYMFPSHRWLCKDEADGKVEVEIYPSETLNIEKINYEVTVVTGDVFAAGTNANVFLQVYGEEGKTEVIQLKSRSNNFERGTTEIFKIEALDVGLVYKIRIGHDGSGVCPGWFLESVEVKRLVWAWVKPEKKEEEKKDKKKKKKKKEEEDDPGELKEVVKTYNFPCSRWLARDEEDGEILVELKAEDYEDLENTYEVHVFTGTMWGAGTDASVYINVYGEIGDTGERKLRKSNHLNKFERGQQEDVFSITAMDLGLLKKLRIRHDNKQANAAWYLDRVEIVDSKDETYFFPCQRWLAVDEDDGQLARELVPVDEAFMNKEVENEDGVSISTSAQLGLEQKMSTTYTMTIKTGEKKYGGTDANIFAILYGTNDDTVINLKASKNHKNKFEVGMIDEFTIEAVDIGKLKRIRIGHDNATSPGWFLDWVEINAPSLGQLLRFPCGRWLDRAEDDGATFRDLYPNELQTELYTPVPYEIKVFTSDIFAAGTDADVFIVLYGQNGVCTSQKSLCVNKRERRMYFERAAENMFILQLEDIGDIIEKIRIGHDNRGVNGGWHLDRVEIRRLLRKGKGSETCIFPCDRWLATSEDDGETIRELVPSDIIIEKLSRDGTLKVIETEVDDALEHTYSVTVSTGDMYGAGTDANVFITMYGDMGDTGERKLSKSENNRNKFERGSVDTFSIEAVDLGHVFKIHIRHDNSMLSPDWYLDQVEIIDTDTDEVFLFQCERWLSRNKEDKRIDRFFYVKVNVCVIPYHLTLATGLDQDAGTTSRAYVIIKGPKQKHTERLWLDTKGKNFSPGGLDYFTCYGTDVGEIKKVEVIYEVTVVTGDVQHAGTDTQIYITVYGKYGTSEEIPLPKLEDFERGQTDIFNLEIEDIAPLRKMRVRIDGTGSRPDWYLDKIILHNLESEEVAMFTYDDWLSRAFGPKHSLVCEMPAVIDDEEMVELTIYTVSVKTSDTSAGTDARVWMIIFGENGDTGTFALKESNNTNKFERKQTDTFRFEDILSLGELSKIRVWHDNTPAAGWHLEYVDVHDDIMGKKFRFQCDRWLAKNEDDGQIMREVACANNEVLDFDEKTYEVITTTADTDDAETKENAWIILEGKKARSKEFVMENSTKKKRFLGASDRFEFSSKELGDIASICLGHSPKDGKKSKVEAYWRVEEVVITEKELGNYIFMCDSLIPVSSKREEFQTFECTKFIESFASKARSLVPVRYEIVVITGDVKGAGTDANVFVTIFGSNGDSGRRQLRQKFRNLFERGRTDRFTIEVLDVGDLLRIWVEHDNSGISPGWLLSRIEVTNTANGVTTIFLCGKWLDKNKADGRIKRVLYPKY
uniref:Lipoxygenase homology PLAT domains 1 n=1 Tax=Astyanax mexicanus TaxID=7994 RepID=W5L5M4_ASTMX